MRPRTFFAAAIACHFGLLVNASQAQQAPRPGSANPVRRGFYSRVQTQSVDATATANGGRSRSGLAPTRSLERDGATIGDPFRGEPDPLRPYGNDDRIVATSSSS